MSKVQVTLYLIRKWRISTNMWSVHSMRLKRDYTYAIDSLRILHLRPPKSLWVSADRRLIRICWWWRKLSTLWTTPISAYRFSVLPRSSNARNENSKTNNAQDSEELAHWIQLTRVRGCQRMPNCSYKSGNCLCSYQKETECPGSFKWNKRTCPGGFSFAKRGRGCPGLANF